MPITDPSGLRLVLTREMAEMLVGQFDRYSTNGVVTLECNESGLWMVDAPTDRVLFVGNTGPRIGARERFRRMAN